MSKTYELLEQILSEIKFIKEEQRKLGTDILSSGDACKYLNLTESSLRRKLVQDPKFRQDIGAFKGRDGKWKLPYRILVQYCNGENMTLRETQERTRRILEDAMNKVKRGSKYAN